VRTDPTFWIVARASGFTAYILLTCTSVAGPALKSRALGRRVKPATVTDAHRFLALLALLAIGVHGITLLYDTSIRIDLLGLVVPGRIPYRPLWVGSGVVAAELTVLVYLSFPVRKLIRVRNWRRLHRLTYGIFGAATAHGLLAGSDSSHPWAHYVYLAALGTVTTAATYRLLTRPGPPRLAAVPAPASRSAHETRARASVA
jgi:methionine sulfoxide reductase heme-binding subunit